MKVGILSAILLLSLPVARVDAAPVKTAKKAARRTVLDYFRLLPPRFFEVSDRRALLRKEFLPVIDIKNDFMQTGGDAAQPSLEIAVFRFRGRDTVAISVQGEMKNSFDLLRLEKGRWKNVTQLLSPLTDGNGLHFVLPRHGTTIRVFQSNDILLAKMYWENGRFQAESFDASAHH